MIKAISNEVMQELITKLEEIINNYCHNLEYFSDSEVDDFFQASTDEVTYYNGLINDNIESQNFLWSSKHVAEKIAQSIIEANGYTDNMIKNIASIKLKYVTSLPTSEISENTIYILKASDSSSKDTLNLYNTTDGWTSIGDFNISLDDYYTKTEIDTKMDLKANKTEVIANDKIVQTLDSTTNSSDTVLSTSGLQVEMDKKANDDEVIKKTSLVTTIDSSSTEDTVPSSKSVYDKVGKYKIYHMSDLGITNSTTLPEMVQLMSDYSILYVDWNPDLMASNSKWFAEDIGYGLLEIVRNTSGFIRLELTFLKRKFFFEGNINDVTSNIMFLTKVCTTSVADVNKANITYNTGQSNYVALSEDGTNFYSVTNGICQCSIYYQANVATAQGSWVNIVTGLPKPKNHFFDVIPSYNNSGAVCQGHFLKDGTFKVSGGTNASVYMYTFTYPVA